MTEQEFIDNSNELDNHPASEGTEPTDNKTEVGDTKTEVVEKQTSDEPPTTDNFSDAEQEAYELGWRPKEEYKGDPDNWSGATAYVKYRKQQDQINKQNNDFTKKIKELNTYHVELRKSQLEMQKKQFEDKRDEAFADGDKEAFKKNQQQIDDLSKEEYEVEAKNTQADVSDDPDVNAWLARNNWMSGKSPLDVAKASFAGATFDELKVQHPYETTNNLMQLLDGKIDEAFPTAKKTNPNRLAPSNTETSTRRPSASKRDLVMSDLTSEEQDLWRNAGHAIFGGSQKVFLESVKNSRQ